MMDGKNPHIVVLGAGFGGLMTALRLHQAGFQPRIYESATDMRPLGVVSGQPDV